MNKHGWALGGAILGGALGAAIAWLLVGGQSWRGGAAELSGLATAFGIIEMWPEQGESTQELGTFTLRALDGLLDGLTAARESSTPGEAPASLHTAALPDRPRHRKT